MLQIVAWKDDLCSRKSGDPWMLIKTNVFRDKKTKEPIVPHKVPAECWENVAVDLFGLMPSSKHIVVVQDMASRYPAAKLMRNSSAKEVLLY